VESVAAFAWNGWQASSGISGRLGLEYAEIINSMLLEKGIDSVVLKGAMRAAERKNIEERLPTAQVVVATGKYVGEGFDLPRLDTLFLAMPIAWKGSLAQYAGRIHRESDGKERVTIHDYVDCSIPMLQRMFRKREKSYKAMGYQFTFNEKSSEVDQLSTEFLLASHKMVSEAPA
jgi:superfamily II DNA or RNA helicase